MFYILSENYCFRILNRKKKKLKELFIALERFTKIFQRERTLESIHTESESVI